MSLIDGGICLRLPGALGDAGQFASVRHLSQADAAETKLTVDRVGTTTPGAPCVAANLELRLAIGLVDECFLGHVLTSP